MILVAKTTFLEFTTTVLSLIAYWLVEALTSYNKQGCNR